MPKRSGSTPAVANATNRASGANAERARAICGGHDDRCRAVARLRRVAGRHRTRDVKCRLQLGERLERRIPPRPFVHAEDRRRASAVDTNLERHDLVLEPAGVDSGDGLLVAGERERVLFLAGHCRLPGVVLGHEPRREVDVRVGIHQHRIGRDLVPSHRHEAHRLGSARDDDVGEPGHDSLCAVRDRLQPGRAESIDRQGGRRHRHAGAEAGDSCHVQALLGLRHRAAEDDIFDFRWIEAGRARECLLDCGCRHFVRPSKPQCSARRLATCRSHG